MWPWGKNRETGADIEDDNEDNIELDSVPTAITCTFITHKKINLNYWGSTALSFCKKNFSFLIFFFNLWKFSIKAEKHFQFNNGFPCDFGLFLSNW